jgi:hypothetical protein
MRTNDEGEPETFDLSEYRDWESLVIPDWVAGDDDDDEDDEDVDEHEGENADEDDTQALL